MATPSKKTMVCVTVQKTCERLIRKGAAIAGDAGISIVHVAKNGEKLLGGGNDGEALDYLFRISREYGAEMDMVRADDVVKAIVDFARQNEVECIVLGAGGMKRAYDYPGKIQAMLPGVSIVTVS